MIVDARSWPPPMEFEDELPSLRDRRITLIAKRGSDLVFAINVGDKQDLIEQSRGRVWAVWTGRWSSDLFVVPRRVAVEAIC